MSARPAKDPLRVGIGGPVGSGKTALMDGLCKRMRGRYELVAITNDIYTREDAEFLTRSGALPAERIRADHVIAGMVEGLGGRVTWLEAPFDPEIGAYGGGVHSHHHDDDR